MPRFDFDKATPREILAEADRRCRNRLAGRAVTDDGPDGDALLIPDRQILQNVRGVGRAVRPPDDPGPLELPLPPTPIVTELQLTLPWSHLLADNRKYAPAMNKQRRATIILTQDYRTAKRHAEAEIDKQLAGQKPIVGPVRLVGRFIEPDRRSRRDIANYTKLVHDALNGRAYLDDSLLDDVHWIRGACDIDRPRLELTVTSTMVSR